MRAKGFESADEGQMQAPMNADPTPIAADDNEWSVFEVKVGRCPAGVRHDSLIGGNRRGIGVHRRFPV
jgi:hypothetical protein